MVRRDDRFELSRDEGLARRAAYYERRIRESRLEPPAPETTLGKIRAAYEWFWLYCEIPGCGHNVAMPVAPLIIRWGPEAPRCHLLRGFRCTRCGGRETSIRFPSWGGKEVGWKTIDEGRQWTGTAVWPEPLSMHYMEDRAYGAGRFHFSPVLDLLMEDAS